jgi:lipopolysaccharide/colanic/teichoic acid biosynthesis glycosyltransferase
VVEGKVGKIMDVSDIPGLVPIPRGPFRWVTRWQALRRLLDLTFAALWLILTMPLIAILAALIVLDSPGPALFRQQRMGKDGRLFTMLKLRSMVPGAAAIDVPLRTRGGREDPRITRVGRVIRALRVDELPQLYNVLKGDMSVFGSRPELPR